MAPRVCFQQRRMYQAFAETQQSLCNGHRRPFERARRGFVEKPELK
jgi:hypothetical protein